MDTFMNLAKQGYEAYSESQSNVSRTGGEEYNTPHGQNYPQEAQPDIDHNQAVQRASEQDDSGDSSVYSHAMSYINNNKHQHTQPVDEEHVTNAHQEAYENGNASSLGAGSMGSAAAMQVLKQFTSGGGGGGSQTELISMAMSEASKLFDASGGAASGNKQDAVNGAAMTIMKLVVQSKFSSITGGGNSGGMGSLMGLATKFL